MKPDGKAAIVLPTGFLTTKNSVEGKSLKHIVNERLVYGVISMRPTFLRIPVRSYFWGGKSSAIGWDSRWGTPKKVTAAGSNTTGMTIPYGLDCSGFVDWVFNNTFDVMVGHGGGAGSQYSYCRKVSWAEAQPGDLVFYPDLGHVGIVAGYDGEGNVLIVHCSLNGVVVTGRVGFALVGRPEVF